VLASRKYVGYTPFMLGRTYEREVCSAARALETAGERWSLLILRNAAFAGMTRFTDFQKSLGIAPNVLSARLERFVEDGLMAVAPGAQGHPEYHLTDRGLDFKPVIIALTEWGDRWAAPDGPPIVYEHDGCGGRVVTRLECERCGETPRRAEVVARKTAVMAELQARRRAGEAPE
jgi:DNA-binding HxlR family transcriptional regulator